MQPWRPTPKSDSVTPTIDLTEPTKPIKYSGPTDEMEGIEVEEEGSSHESDSKWRPLIPDSLKKPKHWVRVARTKGAVAKAKGRPPKPLFEAAPLMTRRINAITKQLFEKPKAKAKAIVKIRPTQSKEKSNKMKLMEDLSEMRQHVLDISARILQLSQRLES